MVIDVFVNKRTLMHLAWLLIGILALIVDSKFGSPAWKFVVDGFVLGIVVAGIFYWRLIDMGHSLIDDQHQLIERIMSDVIDPIKEMSKNSSYTDLDQFKELIKEAQKETIKKKK